MSIEFGSPDVPALPVGVDVIDDHTIEIAGRKYRVIFDSGLPGAYITEGPPEGLVDSLGLPEPFATRLHNILFARNIFTYKDISNVKTAFSVVQEALQVDAQRLTEAFHLYEKETL